MIIDRVMLYIFLKVLVLLNIFNFICSRIHALVYVIKYGRMGNDEKTFMKEIVETFFQATNQRQRLILAVTNSTDKLIHNSKFTQDWISKESVHPNSPLNYFLNEAYPGENEITSKSRIYFINCKNPEEEEEPGDDFPTLKFEMLMTKFYINSILFKNEKKSLILFFQFQNKQ